MLARAIEVYKKINAKGTPEDSVILRAVIFATVMTGAVGILSQGYFSTALNSFVILGLIFGYYYSYKKRDENNLLIKVILTFSLIGLMILYLYDVANTYFDPRIPLAKLFLLLQVSHSFDLPRRRDLEFSLFFSLVTIGLGAVLATNMTYLLFAGLYGLFYLPSLILLYVSELRIKVETFLSKLKPQALPRMLIWLSVTTALLSILFFIFLPRVPVQSKYTFPIKAPAQLNLANPNQFSNPLYPQTGGGSTPNCDLTKDPTCGQAAYDWKSPPKVNPDSYYGFNSFMDLRSRGVLSEKLVMRVKTIYPSLYRGVIFDRYNGLGWEIADKSPVKVELRNQPFVIPFVSEDLSRPNKTEVITTFMIESESSNSIFLPYRAEEIYFPSEALFVDNNLGIRAPFYLDRSITYTSISQVDKPDYTVISQLDKKVPKTMSRYLQLPEEFPDRVRDLALEVTKTGNTPYEKVALLDAYLKNNYPYDLDIAPQDKKMDSVEYFLFEQKRGYCEMFASALTTMSRSIGVPARVVTGYRPGDFNPFAGAYEIKALDAHAWVDAYIPGYGWVEFDPTPSFGVPRIEKRYFVYKDTFEFFKKQLDAAIGLTGIRNINNPFSKGEPGEKKANSDLVRTIKGSIPITIALIIIVIIVIVFRKNIHMAVKRSRFKPDYYKRMLAVLENAGYSKQPHETPNEFQARIQDPDLAPIVFELTKMYVDEAYGNKRIYPAEVADNLILSLEHLLKDKIYGRSK